MPQDEHACGSGWTPTKVALELGAIVKARSQRRAQLDFPAPPSSSRFFSHLQFTTESSGRLELANEGEIAPDISLLEDEHDHYTPQPQNDQQHPGSTIGGWLEDDDIEDFDF